MRVEFKKVAESHQRGGDHRSLTAWTDDYAGTVNGKSFNVQIDPCAAPRWSGTELDDDEKADVLAAIGD